MMFRSFFSYGLAKIVLAGILLIAITTVTSVGTYLLINREQEAKSTKNMTVNETKGNTVEDKTIVEMVATENDTVPIEIDAKSNNSYLSDYLNAENVEWLSSNGFEIDPDHFLLIDTQTSSSWDDLLEETIHNTVYLFFYDYTDFTHSSWNSFLLVESETTSGIKQLPQMLDYCIFGMTMYIHDVDGDKQEEIIIHQDVDMFGGAGQYRTMVYKIADYELKEIFKSPSYEGLFDTGFRSSFLDGHNFQISNIYTGYSEVFDFINYDSKESFWDENGLPRSWDDWDEWDGSWLCVDSFYSFCPIDVDNDGVFEFECVQYSYLNSHADYIGDAKSVIKYNAETSAFDVVFAEFELYYELDTKHDRNITRLEDLYNPEIIEQGEFIKIYFEKPYRYYYIINDKNTNIVTEGGSFGVKPYSEYVSDSLLVVRNINGIYDSEIYYNTGTGRLSEAFSRSAYHNDDLIVFHNDNTDGYIIQYLFGTEKQVILKEQLQGIDSLWYPFVDIRIIENDSKLELTYITDYA